MNRLTNWSFEDGYHHQDGVPELAVPDGWQLHFVDGPYPGDATPPNAARPESVVWNKKDAPQHEKSIFFLDGDYCLKIFKAGLPVYFAMSQHVTGLTPGIRYRFTAQVYPDLVHGYEGGKKVRPTDEWAGEARAGWSAPGGRWVAGQEGGDIAWGDWFNVHNGTMTFGEYGDVWVEFVADTSGEMRVWLECKAKWGDNENNFFMDAFTLEAVGGEPEPPAPEPEPEQPEQPEGTAARVPYARAYVLLPQDISLEMLLAAARGSYPNRFTIGFSADDAGIGAGLESRLVIAVNPQDIGTGLTQSWYDEHYNGAVMHALTAETPTELETKLADIMPLPEPEPEPEPSPPVPVPEPEPPPAPTGGEVISVHVQQWPSDGSLDYFIATAKPAVVKLVLGMEGAHRVKSLSPGTAVVYRQWVSHQDPYWKHPDGAEAGARAYLETFLDSLHHNADVVDYVESLNETVATGNLETIDRTVAFDVAFCEALEREGYPARPVVLNVAVGNPEHGTETAMLALAAKAAQQAGGAVGYHSYWAVCPNWCSLDADFEHYSGRALESWDATFAAAGVAPTYIFGEGGAVAISSPGGAMNAGAGWRHDSCLDGDWDAYVAQIMQFRSKVLAWNAEHGGRCLGMTLFTVRGGDSWKYFELGDKLRALADALAGA